MSYVMLAALDIFAAVLVLLCAAALGVFTSSCLTTAVYSISRALGVLRSVVWVAGNRDLAELVTRERRRAARAELAQAELEDRVDVLAARLGAIRQDHAVLDGDLVLMKTASVGPTECIGHFAWLPPELGVDEAIRASFGGEA